MDTSDIELIKTGAVRCDKPFTHLVFVLWHFNLAVRNLDTFLTKCGNDGFDQPVALTLIYDGCTMNDDEVIKSVLKTRAKSLLDIGVVDVELRLIDFVII